MRELVCMYVCVLAYVSGCLCVCVYVRGGIGVCVCVCGGHGDVVRCLRLPCR